MTLLRIMALIIQRFAAPAYRRKKVPGTFKHRWVLIYLLSLVLIAVISCNPEEWELVDCSECYTERPSEAEINVKLSIDRLNPSVIIDVYSGRLEEEILILSETVTTETWSTILPVDEYYSVTATYSARTGDFNVTAIDGNHVRTREVRAICDETCWVIRGNNFNVKLKY